MDLVGVFLGIMSLAYAWWTNVTLARGIKIGALQQIRTLIGRLEEDKNKLSFQGTEWQTIHHTQQNLEDVSKSLKAIFQINDPKL